MQNKLKDVFSNKKCDFGVNLLFKDSKAQKKFMEAIETISEGKVVDVEDISSVSLNIKDGNMSYPFVIVNDINHATLNSCTGFVPIKVNTEYGEQIINMEKHTTQNGFVLKTKDKEAVFLKFDFNVQDSTLTFVYKIQPEFEKDLKELIKKLITALGLINSMFKLDNNKLEDGSYAVVEIKKYFEMQYKLLKKMNEIQEFFGILFDTSKISELRNSDIQDIEELYALIIEKKAVRLNSKLIPTETTGIKFKQDAKIPKVGANIDIVFTKTVTYSICGQNITIYTANILLNAVVKEILTYDNGETKVLYGDEDRKPMYILYTGFKTRDEAEQEYETLMENKQKYVEAFQKTN